MKTMTVGKKKEIVGYFLPHLPKTGKRELGILQGRADIEFSGDFKMTEEEFLGL
jgi:hypothetical protein